MIAGDHSYIRTAEPDDASALHQLYRMDRPRAALLDNRREPLLPSVDELREVLSRKEAAQGTFFTVEDRAGVLQGFCVLRGTNHEAAFGEVSLLFLEDRTFEEPLAGEVFAFLYHRGLERLRLNKVLTHCLDSEEALRRFLMAHHFESEGVQREVLFAQGRWHDLETLALFRGKAAIADLPQQTGKES